MRNIAFYEGVSAILVETSPTIAKYMNELIGEVEALKEEVENAQDETKKVKAQITSQADLYEIADEAAEREFTSLSWGGARQLNYTSVKSREWIKKRPNLMEKLGLRFCDSEMGIEKIPEPPTPIVEAIEEVLREKAPAVAPPDDLDLPF